MLSKALPIFLFEIALISAIESHFQQTTSSTTQPVEPSSSTFEPPVVMLEVWLPIWRVPPDLLSTFTASI